MESVKPVILWLADNPGWAYASIVEQVSQCLPGYRHEVYYLSMFMDSEPVLSDPDIVVPMYLHYHKGLDRKDNMVMMLTGMRPFE